MLKNVLAVLLVGALATVASAVNATWSEEMNAAPGLPWTYSQTGSLGLSMSVTGDMLWADWSGGNPTGMDYTTIPGAWYDAPNLMGNYGIPDPYTPPITWPKSTSWALVGDKSPLVGKRAYTMDFRFKFTPFATANGGVGQRVKWKVFYAAGHEGDPDYIIEDGWYDEVNNVKWPYFEPNGDDPNIPQAGWNYSLSVSQESTDTQTWFAQFGQQFQTGIGDITMYAMTKSGGPVDNTWVPYLDNDGNPVFETTDDGSGNPIPVLDWETGEPLAVYEKVGGGMYWNANFPTEPELIQWGNDWNTPELFGQTNNPTTSRWTLGPGTHHIQDPWSGANPPFNNQFVADQWYLLRVVADPTSANDFGVPNVAFYIDGVLAYVYLEETDLIGANAYADGLLGISKGDYGSYGVAWDYLRVYDGVLSPTETLDAATSDAPGHYCAGYVAGDANLDCKYDLNDFAIMAAHWLECQAMPSSLCGL